MRRQKIIQLILFLTFFGIGAASLGAAILSRELLQYYRSSQLLTQSRQYSQKLQSLNEDYDALLELLENDPDFARRVAPALLGTEPNEPDTAYPSLEADNLAAAREALKELSQLQTTQTAVPPWLQRCSRPERRITLFLAGAALIIIALVCFNPKEKKSLEKQG